MEPTDQEGTSADSTPRRQPEQQQQKPFRRTPHANSGEWLLSKGWVESCHEFPVVKIEVHGTQLIRERRHPTTFDSSMIWRFAICTGHNGHSHQRNDVAQSYSHHVTSPCFVPPIYPHAPPTVSYDSPYGRHTGPYTPPAAPQVTTKLGPCGSVAGCSQAFKYTLDHLPCSNTCAVLLQPGGLL